MSPEEWSYAMLVEQLVELVSSYARDMKLLLVDDNSTDINYCKLLFAKRFKECDTANDGEEALEILNLKGYDYFDLVVTDIVMPKLDGIELVKHIKGKNFQQKVVLMTSVDYLGSSKLEDVVFFADGILLKPLTLEKSYRVLYKILKDISEKRDYDYYVKELESSSLKNVERSLEDLDQEQIEESNFFEFDSEDVESTIEQMHLLDHEKVSAKEIMQSGVIDSYMIEDLKDALNDFETVRYVESLNDDYLIALKNVLEQFISIFNINNEFKDIAFSLEKLKVQILDRLEIEKIDKNLFKLLFDSVIEDLEKFSNEVLEEQTAIDIHYLDASLFSNISQIEMMINK